MEDKYEVVLDNKCPQCGSDLKYNAKTQNWLCDYCRKSFTLEELKKHNNSSNEKYKSNKDDDTEYISYKCSHCGAEIITDDQVASTFCVYCRNTAIIRSKLSGKFSPDLIIPFKVTKEKAINAFKDILKGRPLAPRDFNSESNIEKIRGVYIPFWLYDIKTEGRIDVDGTYIRHWRTGDYSYTETKKYDCIREGVIPYEKVPSDGSTRFDNEIMNSIEPFDYKELEEYNHAYLSGFLAEKYDVEKEEAYEEADKRTLNSSLDAMLDDIHVCGTKIVKTNTLKNTLLDSKYALLPVYMVNVKYKGKLYIFAMNGQTGEFIGNIPLDKRRRFVMFLLVFLGLALIVFIISYIVYMVGVK